MKKIFAVVIMLSLTGCLGRAKLSESIDWSNLHRVGPATEARVYRYDAENKRWRLTKEKVLIPEGQYIAPPPTVYETPPNPQSIVK